MPEDPCKKKVSAASDGSLTEAEAAANLARMSAKAKLLADQNGTPVSEALKDVAGELSAEQRLNGELEKRNLLLNVRARREARRVIGKHKTLGEGLVAFLEGNATYRRSVDYLAKSLHHKYLGRLISELEEAGVIRDFKSGKIGREIYIEMGEIKEGGTPGRSGNVAAQKIAAIVEGVTSELVARQNRAGAYIDRIPGYIARQNHDMAEIRSAGGPGNNAGARERSRNAWSEFTLPLLDPIKTFGGENPGTFMRNVHEALYTGVHGADLGELDTMTHGMKDDVARRASRSRLLHFKDAESAWTYNERFGTRHIRDQVFSDLFYRTRSVSVMENLGPTVGSNFDKLMRELQEEARIRPDADVQVDSLKDWRIQAAFDTATGRNDIPTNHTFARAMNNVRAITILAKMGATTLAAFSDKAFMHSELGYQGISQAHRLGAQLAALSPKNPEQLKMLRMMGVALDGIIGNTVARYTTHTTASGVLHKLQQNLFNLNFLNWWTDGHKGAAAEVMSANLGEHANLKFEELPDDLGRVLSLYEITAKQWDAIRSTAWGDDIKYVTPDKLQSLSDEVIDGLLAEKDLKATDSNRIRMREQLDSSLRTYFTDRVDYAIPTPGAAEKKWTTLGTKPGTPLGEGIRMVMMFKAFPITIMTKILDREVHGTGSDTMKQWLMSNHKGKFNTAMLIASATIMGYLSGVVRDALKGRTPKPLVDEDGSINMKTLNDAAMRGGGMGILGDYLLRDYDRAYNSLSGSLAGPVLGQLDPLAEMATLAKKGQGNEALERAGKFTQDNTPFINLFYIRPVMDYLIFYNMQEALSPGSLHRMEKAVEKNGQGFWKRPSEMVK